MSRLYWWMFAGVWLPLALVSVTAVGEEPVPPRPANANLSTILRRAVGTNEPAAVELADNDPRVRQVASQLQSIVTSELSLVRSVCDDLSPLQRAKIKKAFVASLDPLAKRIAQDQSRPRQAQVVNGVVQVDQSLDAIDPVKEVRQSILHELEINLSDDQFRRWKPEFLDRNEDRKKAAILLFISTIDAQLFLNDEQRTWMEKKLRDQWRDEWESWIVVIKQYERSGYIPFVSDELVLPHLNGDQQAVWSGMRKIRVNNIGLRIRQQQVDDPWWDEASVTTDVPVTQSAP